MTEAVDGAPPSDFDERIATLDPALFARIESQSSDDDKRSLLACQLAVRTIRPAYSYLEIGSYLGGSLQPHLLDDRCTRIVSIDRRGTVQPDERGVPYAYRNNSTARMLGLLRAVSPSGVTKVATIDGTTADIDTARAGGPIDLCFVDGEHTDEAVVRDFRFCLDVLADDGAVVFHDASIVYNGLSRCIELLEDRSTPFRAYSLPEIVFVIEVGDFPLHRQPAIHERLVDNHRSYLAALRYNDHYRRFANKGPFRLYRTLKARAKGLNSFD